MFTSNEQMQKILAASTYSARYVTLSFEPYSHPSAWEYLLTGKFCEFREEQMVWQHRINE